MAGETDVVAAQLALIRMLGGVNANIRFVGQGEPGTTVVAPAIGNAIFAAIGVRLRHLPIRPAAVREALASHGSGR